MSMAYFWVFQGGKRGEGVVPLKDSNNFCQVNINPPLIFCFEGKYYKGLKFWVYSKHISIVSLKIVHLFYKQSTYRQKNCLDHTNFIEVLALLGTHGFFNFRLYKSFRIKIYYYINYSNTVKFVCINLTLLSTYI